ncbi:MAG: hypothetical protein AB9903_25405 [Vulcanimicrobiota bacterium]
MHRFLKRIVTYLSGLAQEGYWKRFNVVYAALLYTLFALIITFPIILNLDRVVTGSLGTDITRVGIFSVCQTKKALLETHMFSLFADKVNYPIGGYLFYFDPLTSVYEVILSPLFKFPVDYNLIFLLNIVGGALAAYFLVYYLTKNTIAAFVGGVIVGFCPVRFTSYIDGVSEYAHIMWLPLYVLYLHRLYEEKEKTLENVFICGILFFLCFFAGWYFGLYALLLTTALLLYHIFWNPATRNEKAAVIKKTVYAFIVGASLIYPFTLAQFQILSYDERAGMGSGITVKGDARVRSIFARTNSPDVKEFFCRGKGESDNRSFPMHQMVYLGYVSLILAGIGLVTGRRNRNVILWAILGVFFFLVTLGPCLTVWGKYQTLWAFLNRKYLGLYGLLCGFFPGFKMTNHPYRFAFLVQMSMAVLAGFGVVYIIKSMGESRKSMIAGLCIGLFVFLEYCFLSPMPHPLHFYSTRKPLMYEVMAMDKENYAVLDVPRQKTRDEKSTIDFHGDPSLLCEYYMYYLSIHQKPIPYNWHGRFSNTGLTGKSTFLRCMENKMGPPPFSNYKEKEFEPLDFVIRDDILNFKKQGFKYVILHKNLIPESQCETLSKFLEKYLGEPIKEKDRWIYII